MRGFLYVGVTGPLYKAAQNTDPIESEQCAFEHTERILFAQHGSAPTSSESHVVPSNRLRTVSYHTY